ncbi:MAG: hypothetical protein ACREDF_08345 [Thermoplasmata archaeon]
MSTVEIVSYRETGESTRYRETFDEAYYDLDEAGNVDIVLHRMTPGAMSPEDAVAQTIHVRTVWRCVPGQTVAHSTQINGTVTYAIVGGDVGATFEGAGSVFFRENRAKDEITGTLDLVRLKPAKKLNNGSDLFYRTELSAEFRAKRDPRTVVAFVHSISEKFDGK